LIPLFFGCPDVSTTMIVTPGPVIDFLLTNQNVRGISDIDWPRVPGIKITCSGILTYFLSKEQSMK
jgi:hypothetical protein